MQNNNIGMCMYVKVENPFSEQHISKEEDLKNLNGSNYTRLLKRVFHSFWPKSLKDQTSEKGLLAILRELVKRFSWNHHRKPED
jgi:hypothetical protein